MSQLDKDVAQYVLAYLARQGFKNTMSVFLQECCLLPSNTTMMVLPETPLTTIVAEYKARQESRKLGPKASWDALWEKLQHYLSQLRILANSLLDSHDLPKQHLGKKRPSRTRTNQLQYMAPPTMPPTTLPGEQPVTCASSTTSTAPSVPTSPRKAKKPVQWCPPTTPSQVQEAPDPSHDPRQLLDVLLEDESLQHHLAHIINSSLMGDGDPELMDHALDEILAMTSSVSHAGATPTSQCDQQNYHK